VGDLQQVRGRCEQSQHEEHPDLGEPRQPVVDAQDVLRRMHLAVAHDETCDVNRQKAAAADAGGCGEDEQRERGREQRVERLRELEPVDDDDHQVAADQSHDAADTEFGKKPSGNAPVETRLPRRDRLHQHDGEKDSHRIVAPRFDFERGAHAALDREAARAQDRKDRRGIRRAHDRPE
jgi:hypothetical protein